MPELVGMLGEKFKTRTPDFTDHVIGYPRNRANSGEQRSAFAAASWKSTWRGVDPGDSHSTIWLKAIEEGEPCNTCF